MEMHTSIGLTIYKTWIFLLWRQLQPNTKCHLYSHKIEKTCSRRLNSHSSISIRLCPIYQKLNIMNKVIYTVTHFGMLLCKPRQRRDHLTILCFNSWNRRVNLHLIRQISLKRTTSSVNPCLPSKIVVKINFIRLKIMLFKS